jgi:hypothetical protein
MDNTFVNHELEAAAKKILIHLIDSEDTLISLYLQPDRAIFLAEHLHLVFKVYLDEKVLQHEKESALKLALDGQDKDQLL